MKPTSDRLSGSDEQLMNCIEDVQLNFTPLSNDKFILCLHEINLHSCRSLPLDVSPGGYPSVCDSRRCHAVSSRHIKRTSRSRDE